jgi:hypothetical protein
MNVFIGPG